METNTTQRAMFNQQQQASWRKAGKVVGWGIIIVVALKFWYIGIPAFIAWYLFKKRKNKFSQETNIIATAVALIIFVSVGIASAHILTRKPTFAINEPQANASMQAKTVMVKGKVNPSSSIVMVNNTSAQTDKDGNFTYTATLNNESNAISVVATNGSKTTSQTLTVKRIFTPEEVVERERLKAEAKAKRQAQLEAQQKAEAENRRKAAEEAKKKAEAEAIAEEEKNKELADIFCTARNKQYVRYVNLDDFSKMIEEGQAMLHNVFNQAPSKASCRRIAGQCLKIWSDEDCKNMAERKIWIGMTADQLELSWGIPEDQNDTVGMWGIHTQWVYDDFGPYVYLEGDNKEDLIVTGWQD